MKGYRKLKKENEQLKKELATLIFHSGSIAAAEVSEKYRLKKGFEEMAWLGESRSENYHKGGGIQVRYPECNVFYNLKFGI